MAVTVKGDKEIELSLKRMAGQEKAIRNRGLKKSAKVIAEVLEKNTRVGKRKSDRKWKGQRQFEKKTGRIREFPHLKEDVAVGNVSSEGEILIGYGDDTYWRAHFANTGTIFYEGTHFMERTEEEISDLVIEIMAEEFRRGLGL